MSKHDGCLRKKEAIITPAESLGLAPSAMDDFDQALIESIIGMRPRDIRSGQRDPRLRRFAAIARVRMQQRTREYLRTVRAFGRSCRSVPLHMYGRLRELDDAPR